jgi:hypothetical protein
VGTAIMGLGTRSWTVRSRRLQGLLLNLQRCGKS